MFEGAGRKNNELNVETLKRKMDESFQTDLEITGFISSLFDKLNPFFIARFPREHLQQRAQEQQDAGNDKMAEWLKEIAASPETNDEISKRFGDRAEHMKAVMRDDKQMRRIARIVLAALD